MISGEFTRKVDVDAEILMTPIRTLYASGDKNAHTFELSLYRNKEPLKIDGAGVIGYFLRADGYTVPVSGTASGNVAKVTLAESCYTVVGQFNLIIKVTVGSERKAVFWGNGYVTRSQTDSVIDPGKTIPSLDELLAQIAAVEAATKAANTAASTANTAASNADEKASLADTAASTANASAKAANASADAADKATASASAAAGKIDGMTVAASGLPAGTAPTAKLTEEDGHYKLALGVPKGDTGASGVYTGPDEPTDPDIDVWINPDGTPTDVELLAARQNILTGSENGNPVSVNDAFTAPLCGLHIYGRSRQDGTPSADNPVEIIGAGADGTLQVKITGANLLDFEKITTTGVTGGLSFTFEDEVLTVKTTSVKGYAGVNIPLPIECTGKMVYFKNTFTSNPDKLNAIIQVRCNRTTGSGAYIFYPPAKIPEDVSSVFLNVMARNEDSAAEGTLTIERPVVCYGSKLLPYEPYHEQVITVQTSGGLHGIPVSSGGNYTDADGQQWVCDELDFAQGKLIRRVNVEALDATKTLSGQSGFEMEPVEFPLSSEEIAAYGALMAYAQTTVVQAKNVAGIWLDYQRDVNRVIKKLEDALASMAAS